MSFESEKGNPEIQAWRDALVEDCTCFWCGGQEKCGLGNLFEVHHVEFRSHVAKGRSDAPCNLFLAHKHCHQPILHQADKAIVLSRKLLHDPENFDLDAFLRLRDPELKAPDRITLRDIVRYLEPKR